MRSVLSIAIFVTTVSALAAEMPRQSPDKRSAVDLSSPVPMDIFRPVLRDSAKIFSGTVLQVEHRHSDSSSALATTRILFRVDQAIRSVKRGQVVEVNEWAGLWQSGERYHRGERVLLFLYPPSKLGLTSLSKTALAAFPWIAEDACWSTPEPAAALSRLKFAE